MKIMSSGQESGKENSCTLLFHINTCFCMEKVFEIIKHIIEDFFLKIFFSTVVEIIKRGLFRR